MTVLANKKRAEIPLPAAGEGAILRFTVDSLEKLEAKYGDEYLDIVVQKLGKANIEAFKTCMIVALDGADADEFPWDKPLEDILGPTIDALFLTVYGRTADEQEEEEGRRFEERMERAKKNPLIMHRLSSMLSTQPDTEQELNQTSSEDSPASKSLSTPVETEPAKTSD